MCRVCARSAHGSIAGCGGRPLTKGPVMRLNPILVWGGTALLVGLTACQQDSAPTSPSERPSISAKQSSTRGSLYLLSFGPNVPADLQARLTAAGGKVKQISREAGIAKVESSAANFAALAA